MGRAYAILRHIVSEYGDRARVDEVGMEGRVLGEGKGGRTGLYTHVAKLPTEFIEDGEGVGHRRRGKGSAGWTGRRFRFFALPSFFMYFFLPPLALWAC